MRKEDAAGNSVNDEVAIKLYFSAATDERVDREISALSGFTHPNMTDLLEHGTVTVGTQAMKFVVWSFVKGEALDNAIAARALSFKSVACICRDVSRAIEHILSKRIVHRDINPKNVILKPGDLDATLIDLGVAKHLTQTTLTAPGMTWGTMGYMSPEQLGGAPLTCNADVFSLGITLQECLIRNHPTARNQYLIITSPPKTASLLGTTPAAMATMIDRMLNLRPAFRPSPKQVADTFAELAAKL
jgi:eukaryotic-like serine/threonine-protein kinase